MSGLSSVAVYLDRKEKRYQHDETIAIAESKYLIAIFIYTQIKSLSDHPPEKKALVEDQ